MLCQMSYGAHLSTVQSETHHVWLSELSGRKAYWIGSYHMNIFTVNQFVLARPFFCVFRSQFCGALNLRTKDIADLRGKDNFFIRSPGFISLSFANLLENWNKMLLTVYSNTALSLPRSTALYAWLILIPFYFVPVRSGSK